MDLANMSPKEVRALIREQKITSPTAGMCAGYAQGNLVVLPKDLAYVVYPEESQVLSDPGGQRYGQPLFPYDCGLRGYRERYSEIQDLP